MTHAVMKPGGTRSSTEADLSAPTREEIAQKLGAVLAESYRLLIKTQEVHWTVAGTSLHCLYNLTEEHYENLHDAIDALAARMRALGAKGPHGEPWTIEVEDEEDEERGLVSAEELVDRLAIGHEAVMGAARDALAPFRLDGDHATAELLARRIAWHEHAIWRLRSLMI